MFIRDRIFDKLEELHMTQKSFSEKTGIPQSTISDWRKKRTNPTAEKIMIICEVLGVTPEWLLSGIESQGNRGNNPQKYVIDVQTDSGALIECYNALDKSSQAHLLGYAMGLKKMSEIDRNK
ncbi:MAG: helix-turn-helix transcriptional regulator [Lachnospiraceae bacterium]|nr:helix-turn-helix transcriptional regulator [Lachnospiraceae bacterium]